MQSTLADMADPHWWTVAHMFGAVIALYAAISILKLALKD